MVTLYAEGDLLISRDESIVTATFNRPQTRNALTFDMYERLSVLCKQAAHDQSLRAIILTGAGEKAFAQGLIFRNSKPLSRVKTALTTKSAWTLFLITSSNVRYRLLLQLQGHAPAAGQRLLHVAI